jgi:hypothetical protein
MPGASCIEVPGVCYFIINKGEIVMLKKLIKFEDFDGNPVEREYYFHLFKMDITQLELSFPGGLEVYVTKMISERKIAEIFEAIRKIILTSYGERSADGITFSKLKNGAPLYEDFAGSPAFDVLMEELMNIDPEKQEAAALETFLKGVIPKE